ncbi:MAG: glycosyltransferase family 39 protein [Myxococcota bacterium]
MSDGGQHVAPWVRGIAFAVATVAVLGGTLAVDRAFAHGAHVTWEARTPEDGPYRTVAQTVERNPRFRSDLIPMARFRQHWADDGTPPPAELFPFRATVRAQLTVLRGGRTLDPRHSGNLAITVDGEPYDGKELARGTYDIVATWTDDFRGLPGPNVARDRDEHLEFRLCFAEDSCRNVSFTSWSLKHPWRASRTWLWMLFSIIALAFVGAAVWAGTRARLRFVAASAFLIATLGGGFALRCVDYDTVPDYRENGDELFAGWNGFELLNSGRTRGWSLWPARYSSATKVTEHEQFGMTWYTIQPYFEHPPLLHVLAGAAAHLGGAESWVDVRASDTRIVPIALFIPTALLLFFFVRRLAPLGLAPHLAVLFYSFLPIIALQQRAVKEEALLTPLSLGAILLVLHAKRLRAFVGVGVLVGLCTLTKVTGFAFVPAAAALAWSRGHRRQAFVVFGVGVLVSSLLFAYGAAFGWTAFVEALTAQSDRNSNYAQFLRFLDTARINSMAIGRGWVLFLWITTAVALLRLGRSRREALTIPLVFYWSAIGLGAGSWYYGWYTLPIYPYLCTGTAFFLWRELRRPTLLGGALIAYVLVAYTVFAVVPQADYADLRRLFWVRRSLAWGAGGLLGCAALAVLLRGRAVILGRTAIVLAICGFVAGSSAFCLRYDVLFREQHDVDLQPMFRIG